MRARSVIEFIRDNRVSHTAQANYRQAAREIAALAADVKAAGDDKTARKFRIFAFVAANAARVEYFDPDPPERPCGVCGGRRVCDWTAHLNRRYVA